MTDQPQNESDLEKLRAGYESHAVSLGLVAIAWGYINSVLGFLFTTVAHPNDEALGSAIWNAVKNDRAQREMLQAAVRANKDLPDGYRSRLQWAFGEINELENIRDTALHAPYIPDETGDAVKLVAAHGTGHIRAVQLQHTKDLGVLFHAADTDMMELGIYVALLTVRLQQGDDAVPWPQKPSLQRLRPPKSPETPEQKTDQK